MEEFTRDGGFVRQWGMSGSGDGEFHDPIGIAADANGNIYVADAGNSRVQKFTKDGVYVQGLLFAHVFLRKAVQSGKHSFVTDLFAGRLTRQKALPTWCGYQGPPGRRANLQG